MSATRERRKNAGSKLCTLLDTEEQVDHFYDNIYGGFEEEDNDIDYDSNDTESEDSVDSDFSIDENEDIESDDQNDEDLRRKSKTKLKFGFSPKTKQTKKSPKTTSKTTINPNIREMTVPLVVDLPSMESIPSQSISNCFDTKMFSETIIENRLKFEEMSEFDSNNNFKDKKKSKKTNKQLTQKELLEEAVITEEINIKSLKEWEKLESEKSKKAKVAKRSIKGPFIRYHSIAMPLIQEINSNDEMTNNQNMRESAKNYSRTFISFSDGQTYDSLLKSLSTGPTKSSKEAICGVTQMPARYFDPISQLPFANSQAFNTIRNQYYNNLETYGNMDNEEVRKWIDWRLNISQKWKEWHQNHSPNNKSDQMNEIKVNTQVIQSKIVPKVNPIRGVNRSGRKRKKY